MPVGQLVTRENSDYEISPCYWVDAIGQHGHSWKLMGGVGPEPERRSPGSAQEIVATVIVALMISGIGRASSCFATSTSRQSERPTACKNPEVAWATESIH